LESWWLVTITYWSYGGDLTSDWSRGSLESW